MLLVADIGNTQTHLGVYQESVLICSWRLSTRSTDTADEILMMLRALLAGHDEQLDFTGIAIASVVPPLSVEWVRAASRLGDAEPLLVSGRITEGFFSSKVSPEEIGSDRIADAVGAVALYGAPVIIVDFGTATNIEVINREGVLEGGVIAPGLVTSADALFSAAARLPRIDIEIPAHVIGASTKAAVQSGLTYGEIDRIDGLVRRIFRELGYETPVVATGGLSRRVLEISSTITDVNDNLTLEGLRIVYDHHRQRSSDPSHPAI